MQLVKYSVGNAEGHIYPNCLRTIGEKSVFGVPKHVVADHPVFTLNLKKENVMLVIDWQCDMSKEAQAHLHFHFLK